MLIYSNKDNYFILGILFVFDSIFMFCLVIKRATMTKAYSKNLIM